MTPGARRVCVFVMGECGHVCIHVPVCANLQPARAPLPSKAPPALLPLTAGPASGPRQGLPLQKLGPTCPAGPGSWLREVGSGSDPRGPRPTCAPVLTTRWGPRLAASDISGLSSPAAGPALRPVWGVLSVPLSSATSLSPSWFAFVVMASTPRSPLIQLQPVFPCQLPCPPEIRYLAWPPPYHSNQPLTRAPPAPGANPKPLLIPFSSDNESCRTHGSLR